MWNTPWFGVKYERLNYLVVTHGAGSERHTVLFTPVPAGATSSAAINLHVAQWYDAVHSAIVAKTGAPPKSANLKATLTGVQAAWLSVIIPLLLVCTASMVEKVFIPGIISAIFIFLLSICYFKMNGALKRGDLDALTSNEPLGDLLEQGTVASSPVGSSTRPLAWSISAWIFIAIGILAVVDTLAMLYRRPFDFTLYPGWAHLFAGVALLTLSRRWRMAALVVLVLMGVGGAVLGLNMILSPEGAVVLFPVASLKISVAEQPLLAATGAVFLTLLFAWPCYMLACVRGKALFRVVSK